MGAALVATAIGTVGCRSSKRFSVGPIPFMPRLSGPALPAPLTSSPNREAFTYVARMHLRRPTRRGVRTIALISWSVRDTSNWKYLQIGEDGSAMVYRTQWDRGTRGGSFGNARPGPGPKRLQAFLDRLGAGVPPPALDRVLIVSCLERGRWTTRVYDRDYAPTPLIDLERALVGAKGGSASGAASGPIWTER